MSDEYLMTGSFGLDVDLWQGSFYDNDLPVDWRVASYSTLLRSVLLPQAEWRRAVEDSWIDEVDGAFRFILYCSSVAGSEGLNSLIDELSSLPGSFSSQVAGLVLEYDSGSSGKEFEDSICQMNTLFPLCLDAGRVDYAVAGMDTFCQKADVSCVWYPAVETAPLSSGEFLVTLIDQETLPEQREIVAQIEQWMSGGRRAGLFNTSKHDAPLRAQETRILAELMGV